MGNANSDEIDYDDDDDDGSYIVGDVDEKEEHLKKEEKTRDKRITKLCQELGTNLTDLNEQYIQMLNEQASYQRYPTDMNIFHDFTASTWAREDNDFLQLLNKTKSPAANTHTNTIDQLFLTLLCGSIWSTKELEDNLNKLKKFKKHIAITKTKHARIVLALDFDTFDLGDMKDLKQQTLEQRIKEKNLPAGTDDLNVTNRHVILLYNYPNTAPREWYVFDNSTFITSTTELRQVLFFNRFNERIGKRAPEEVYNETLYNPYELDEMTPDFKTKLGEYYDALNLYSAVFKFSKIPYAQNLQSARPTYSLTCSTIVMWQCFFLWYTHDFYNDIPALIPFNTPILFRIYVAYCVVHKTLNPIPKMFLNALNTNITRELLADDGEENDDDGEESNYEIEYEEENDDDDDFEPKTKRARRIKKT